MELQPLFPFDFDFSPSPDFLSFFHLTPYIKKIIYLYNFVIYGNRNILLFFVGFLIYHPVKEKHHSFLFWKAPMIGYKRHIWLINFTVFKAILLLLIDFIIAFVCKCLWVYMRAYVLNDYLLPF